MRRSLAILAIFAPILLAGCSTQLSPEDRALLQQTQTDARAANAEAARATAAAQAAAADARTAAAEAKAASEKADRMFARSQRKVQ